jgi:hypothetical protein
MIMNEADYIQKLEMDNQTLHTLLGEAMDCLKECKEKLEYYEKEYHEVLKSMEKKGNVLLKDNDYLPATDDDDNYLQNEIFHLMNRGYNDKTPRID